MSIAIDLEKVKQSAKSLKAAPPAHGEIVGDPKGFLAKHGVEIDEALNTLLKSKLAGAPVSAAQASAIHIDV